VNHTTERRLGPATQVSQTEAFLFTIILGKKRLPK
jgi:hypothetical protein